METYWEPMVIIFILNSQTNTKLERERELVWQSKQISELGCYEEKLSLSPYDY